MVVNLVPYLERICMYVTQEIRQKNNFIIGAGGCIALHFYAFSKYTLLTAILKSILSTRSNINYQTFQRNPAGYTQTQHRWHTNCIVTCETFFSILFPPPKTQRPGMKWTAVIWSQFQDFSCNFLDLFPNPVPILISTKIFIYFLLNLIVLWIYIAGSITYMRTDKWSFWA